MTHALLVRVAEAWALAAALQLALWLVQQRTRNAGIVDVGWALAFTPVVAVFALHAHAADSPISVPISVPVPVPALSRAPLAAIVIAWSLRLGGHLLARGAARAPEEGRYQDLRARWGPRASVRFFVFFQAQAALVALLSTAFVVPFLRAPEPGTWWLRALGAAIAIAGVAGEATADAQLARWKRDPARRSRVCDVGLWAWSRHPNYFFEWCVWIGYAVYGFAFGAWGLIALVPQAIILASIFGVTGIPPTENQAIRSKGDAYREYQKRVSRFIPMPPKTRGNDA